MKTDSIKQSYTKWPSGVKTALRRLVIPPLRAYFRYVPCQFGKAYLWDHVASHLWWLESYVKAKTLFGSMVCADAADIVGRYIYYFGTWEPNLTYWIEQRLKAGDTFIDVGANVGYFSLLASKRVGESGKVVAIEALPKTSELLRSNLEGNKCVNVRAVNMAAWDKEEKLKMFTRAENPPGTTTLMDAWAEKWHLESKCLVAAAPLSSIITLEEMKAARLVKIDVEGAEWRAVNGMNAFLDRSREDLEIILEANFRMLEAEGKTFQDLMEFFKRWGFHPYFIENNYAAEAYYKRTLPSRPVRIKNSGDVPSATLDQIDVIFSRVDSQSL